MRPLQQPHAAAERNGSSRSLEEVRDLLAARGLRTTAQRLAVYRYLLQHRTHPSAAKIYEDLSRDYPTMSRATVYNTLDLLVGLGLVQQLDLGGAMARYDGNPEFHVHAVCETCGSIADVEVDGALASLEGRIASRLGFTVSARRYEILGRCQRCTAKAGTGAAQG